MSHHSDGPSGPEPGGHQGPSSHDRAPYGRPSRGHPPYGRPAPGRPPWDPRDRAYPAGRPPFPPPPPDPRAGPPGWRPPYPLPPVPPVPPPEATTVPQGILWAFVPFLTFGLGTPFSFLYGAIRRGSWNLGVTAAGYGIALTGVMALVQTDSAVLMGLGTMLCLMLWVAGTAHAFAVRSTVFPRESSRNRINQHAIDVAKYRRTLREEARALAAEDPALAHELRIGRPDLPRTYDDGGLVDVNSAPPEVLATLPGMTAELVDRVVARRHEQGAFLSAEEMAVDADVPPDALPRIAEYAIFLP
ncbi:helix-hairpin-helix domain-containing protein [Actinomadura fibrosa]|uniref:Helix-hairpin-helix domain-containing protein n=1 Tax=Actinomadura fibrosa TaxID=111802 RepID=A0ABW2XI74_9ACTN|nr:helix-hairpin-helix domain-containing protein [Actinomadura fibrosa]